MVVFVNTYLMIILAIVAAGAIFSRFLKLRENVVITQDLVDRVKTLVRMGDLDGARELGRKSDTVFGDIVDRGIAQFRTSEENIRQALYDSCEREIYELDRNRIMLVTLAVIAPIAGFLGTALEIILTFGQAANTLSRQEILEAVAGALNVSVWGLLIAIPTLVMFFYFKSRSEYLGVHCKTAANEIARIWRATQKRKPSEIHIEETSDLSSGGKTVPSVTTDETQDVSGPAAFN